MIYRKVDDDNSNHIATTVLRSDIPDLSQATKLTLVLYVGKLAGCACAKEEFAN